MKLHTVLGVRVALPFTLLLKAPSNCPLSLSTFSFMVSLDLVAKAGLCGVETFRAATGELTTCTVKLAVNTKFKLIRPHNLHIHKLNYTDGSRHLIHSLKCQNIKKIRTPVIDVQSPGRSAGANTTF